MTIKAVFFDMGGTIQNYWRSPDLGLRAIPDIKKLLLSAEIDLNLDDQQLYDLITKGIARYHQWSLKSLDEITPQWIWTEYVLADYPVTAEQLQSVAEDIMVIVETHFSTREMRSEIPAVLEQIKKMGLKIGMISNVNNYGQVPLNLDEYGIKQYFDPIVLSVEYGRRKPDPSIFHHAARLAKVPSSACIHVGDRITRDILGAQNAGFQAAVQIKHSHHEKEDEDVAVPDLVIDSMTELLDFLKEKLAEPDFKLPANGGQPDRIRAVLFDAGDILYFRCHGGERFKEFLSELEITATEPHPKDDFLVLKEQAYRGIITHKAYLEGYLRMFGITCPEQIERGIKILSEEKNNVELFEGVQQTLNTLKRKGYLLGIVTDTANTLHAKIAWFESGGIGNLWDSIISSRDIGVRKPDPKIYDAALEQLGIGAAEAVFIGHKATELEGARAVGMKTIAFNYEENATADFYIENFLDLLNVPIISP